MTATQPPSDMRMQRSSRSPAALAGRLAEFLAEQLPAGADPKVTVETGADANGMSSETVVLAVEHRQDGRRRTARLVARIAPHADDLPVFPQYRLDHQFAVMRSVRELTDVPVPAVRWLEPTGKVLGTPFFVMDHVEGRVPPDVLPYTFGDNWFHDAPEPDRRALQDRTVDVIARIHAIDRPSERFAFLAGDRPGETALRRHMGWVRDWYRHGTDGIGRSRLLERALDHLEATWPDEVGAAEPVLLWGDARLGNTLYAGFTPVGVLDWEMTTLGPRQLDVAWCVFAHEVFQYLAALVGVPGIPDTLRAEDVCATYTRLTGHALPELDWFRLYCAVMWGCVFLRTGARQVHFGEIAAPTVPEDLFHHRGLLERMLDEAGAR